MTLEATVSIATTAVSVATATVSEATAAISVATAQRCVQGKIYVMSRQQLVNMVVRTSDGPIPPSHTIRRLVNTYIHTYIHTYSQNNGKKNGKLTN